jgi:hypothetical protein
VTQRILRFTLRKRREDDSCKRDATREQVLRERRPAHCCKLSDSKSIVGRIKVICRAIAVQDPFCHLFLTLGRWAERTSVTDDGAIGAALAGKAAAAASDEAIDGAEAA